MIDRPDPATFAKSILLDSADVPADMTLAQWRLERRAAARIARRRRRRIAWAPRRRLGLSRGPGYSIASGREAAAPPPQR